MRGDGLELTDEVLAMVLAFPHATFDFDYMIVRFQIDPSVCRGHSGFRVGIMTIKC